MKHQIEKMLAAGNDPARTVRADGNDLPFTSPIFAIAFAIGKLSRVIRFGRGFVTLTEAANAYIAEECREAAHYLLQAAALLEAEADDAE